MLLALTIYIAGTPISITTDLLRLHLQDCDDPGQSGADDEPGKFSADYVSSVDYLSDSSNYSPEKEEARARWFYEVTRRERDWEPELEDAERELYCKVQHELFEDAPSNAPWDL